MNIALLCFLIAFAGVFYAYIGYPVILSCLRKRPLVRGFTGDDALPSVTLIVTAHNEAGRIREKIDNSLKIDYPTDRFEIIVASDASTDATDSIVGEYAGTGVRLVRPDRRLGKEYAQGCALREATGEILVFSDVATEIPVDGIREIVSNFADPRVGAVSSEDRFITQDGRIAGEGLYVRYEMWLRRLESSVHSLVGLSGSFFAVRARLCGEWDHLVPSDFNGALNTVRQGLVAVTDPRVLGYYRDIKDPRREYSRKVRTVVRGITALFRRPEVLNPFRTGFFAFQVISHKLLRWAVPWFLAIMLISNLVLLGQGWPYAIFLAMQIAGYAAAGLGWLSERARESTAVRVPYFFVQANVAIAQASLMYLAGKRITTWTPSAR